MVVSKNKFLYVVSGKLKGRKVECPSGEIRPMTSKVRQALFNIIGNCNGKKFLDLFAGSGLISIEAFSNGFTECCLVENDYKKKAIITKNLAHAGFLSARVVISDVLYYCNNCTEQFDFIMLDPPFRYEDKEKVINVISDKELLSVGGQLVIHLPKKELLKEKIGNYTQYDNRNYGLCCLLFYKRQI